MASIPVARRIYETMIGAPVYGPEPGDLGTFSLLGLRLPVRATLVIVVASLVVILDQQYDFLPRVIPFGRDAADMRTQSWERVVLFGVIPLLTLLLLRQSPVRYGLRIGDWRRGLAWFLIGCAVMTPVILWASTLPAMRQYYAVSWTNLPDLTVTNILDLVPSEFLFRGFLMLALLRVTGPLGVLLATMPFVYSHLQKPDLELWSTIFGGTAFGWLAWQTGSILYGAAIHVYILTLLISLSR